MYKITVFVDRKEQGRRVTKPWVRASSEVGFEEAVKDLMEQSETLVAEAQRKRAKVEEERNKKAAEEEAERKKKAAEAERFERGAKIGAGLVEGFEKMRGRERGFTVPSRGLSRGNL